MDPKHFLEDPELSQITLEFKRNACINSNNKETKLALTFSKSGQTINPNCPANVRLVMGHYFYRMNKPEKAKSAFEKALQLDPQCVGAMVGLEIMALNQKTTQSIRGGLQVMSSDYSLQGEEEEEEQEIRHPPEEGWEALRQKILEEERLKEEERFKQEHELIHKIQNLFVEQNRSELMFDEMTEDKHRKKSEEYAEDDGFVSDVSNDGENRERIKRPLNEGMNTFSKKRRRVSHLGFDVENRDKDRKEDQKRRRERERLERNDRKRVKGKENKAHFIQFEERSLKQKGKFGSKEYIGSSGSSSDEEDIPRELKRVMNNGYSDYKEAGNEPNFIRRLFVD